MAIRVALQHVTHYSYDRRVSLAPHVVRLRPAPHCRTPIKAYSLRVTPEKQFLNWQQDAFNNWQARFVFPDSAAAELKVEVELVADLVSLNPFDFFVESYAETFPFKYDAALKRELRQYLELAPTGPRFAQLVGRVRDDVARGERPTIDVLVEINQLIQRSLRYDIRLEPGVFTPEETLVRGHGSCRDFAWLLVNVFRSLGLAARFVSGYSIQLRADELPIDGPVGVLEDCADLHAWAEVYLPGAGFVGFDATSGLACDSGHIPLACTAEPSAAAPITGSYLYDQADGEPALKEDFSFSMQVTRIEDVPRPTKPFNDAQWQALLACGAQVEESLVRGDVRLTMGGEPTFVSVDDPEGDEWNTTALGAKKAQLADELLHRLQRRFAPGGLLHHGQGKWYPGEVLPRWAYSCYFRKDGEPIWSDPTRFAALDAGAELKADAEAAMRLLTALTERLGAPEECIVPAYEDVLYYLWRERRLPVNVDPFESKLESAQERERLRRVFQQGLKAVVGYALPLEASFDGSEVSFRTGRWFLREERMYLTPGDSPMGYRLPLESLPWTIPGDVEPTYPLDPTAPRDPLPPRMQLQHVAPADRDERDRSKNSPKVQGPPRPGTSADGVVRTALCVEPRDGILHVFLPPASHLEAYLALTSAIEACATELDFKVQLEGYEPPSDHRISRLQVTPDPGVIEVNIHPAASFDQLVSCTTGLYEDAKATRLMSNKFMVDGRHTGTGGGNHITLGGPTPLDSPFLRRPDMLRSMLTYWLNHPSLSYLFSGMFVGPTSQAPRIDEARQDSLYELEVAFGLLDGERGSKPPWFTDRAFRHLLADVTGNTHRTEMCIDKMYSPDTASGRQGLLELRAFEMPPHPRMSVAAQLLVRGLCASFWNEPYKKAPLRWTTGLIDRCVLPQFVAQDFRDVLTDLKRAGFAFDSAWYEPQHEFRFPRLGRVATDGIELELRQAIEPWHVLGEQGGAGGTVRYVDSSVERVQVLVRNMQSERHAITCNGRLVPLHPTGTNGEYVAGVRYRAWQPPEALHPTIAPHVPLVFDIFDTWAERAIGGCTYHVAHPGGRSYDTVPRNGLEAEARRNGRFFPFGHSQGTHPVPQRERSPELPLTLDLRRPIQT